AWATNSFMTVLGPLFCILLSMQTGFQSMFFLAALVYLVGFLALRPRLGIISTGSLAVLDAAARSDLRHQSATG
ncbi:MAG: hypothetical protein ACRELG_08500, partial [Gemmataceae bacterium]